MIFSNRRMLHFRSAALPGLFIMAGCVAAPPTANQPLATAPQAQTGMSAAATQTPRPGPAITGTWSGLWDGRLPARLEIRFVNDRGDIGGAYHFLNYPPFVFNSRIVDDSFDVGQLITFNIESNGRLQGLRRTAGDTSVITMTRR